MLNQTTKKQVNEWAWLSAEASQAVPEQYPVTPYGSGYISGIEYQPYYHPSWTPLNPQMLDGVVTHRRQLGRLNSHMDIYSLKSACYRAGCRARPALA